MNLISPIMGAIDAPGIVNALRGNGRTIVTAAFQLLLLREQVRAALEQTGKGSAAQRTAVLEGIEDDLRMIGFSMLLGKPKLMRRAMAAYEIATRL
jgi:hypothetical protein